MRLALLFGVSLGCLGCGVGSPTAPVVPPRPLSQPTSVPVPVPGKAATSALTISHISFTTQPGADNAVMLYVPSVLAMTETSGRSSATVLEAELSAPNAAIERECPGFGPVRIDAGSTRDLVPVIGYCMPYLAASRRPAVTLKIAFVDAEGGTGELLRTIDLAKCAERSGIFVCDGFDKPTNP